MSGWRLVTVAVALAGAAAWSGCDDGGVILLATPTAAAPPSVTAVAATATAAPPTETPEATVTATAEASPTVVGGGELRVGVAAIKLTPCGTNPDWDGPITASGVWGEQFTDTNGNGRWDMGEEFVDDPVNTELDARSAGKYDGIFMAGFGNDRIATGCHDDTWARALVLQSGDTKVAMVSVDFVGEVYYGSYYGFAHAQDMVDSTLGIDAFVFSSTHDHQAPDSLGLWGVDELTDGKFPRYLQFVDREVARAISEAAAPEAMRPVHVIAAQTDPSQSPGLRGLQVRTGCRPPFFFDEEARALQFVDADGQTVATLVNWNTHPESLEDANTLVTSDFIHYIRQRVESELGGTAVYFTGDLGAVEIVGDTCVGGAPPHENDGSNPFDKRDDLGFARTEMLGDLVGDAVVGALRQGQSLDAVNVQVARQDYHIAGTNAAFALANAVGVLDLDMDRFSVDNCPSGTVICVPVEQHLVTLADAQNQPLAQIVTAPGELFPELFYGTAQHHRTDCPQADTGLAYEPSLRDGMSAPYRFLVGLSPDELGYIVPGYDFRAEAEPFAEAPDPCQGQNFDPQVPRRTVPAHYHESLSVGVDIAATTTCYGLRLLGRDDEVNANAACQRVLGAP